AVLNPEDNSIVRFLEEGSYSVCVEGLFSSAVDSYQISIAQREDLCEAELELTQTEDPDQDGLANPCDSDDDNDDFLDNEDNCPLIHNNGTYSYAPDEDGFIRDWLVLGPLYTSGITTTSCLPPLELVPATEQALSPSLGDAQEIWTGASKTWNALFSQDSWVNFIGFDHFNNSPTPREVFAFAWIHSDYERSATLGVGSDDGSRMWLNGTMINEVSSCQGSTVDQFQSSVTLLAGWNRLLIHVRDGGGGWSMYARFLDNGVPITDLEVSLSASGTLTDVQNDSDGDGIGDLCEE
ncbi:MAG: hypothetical protein CMK59_00500, partial [Proteobacteria bacterium]|nr:hypothetical protein [Pseudomonadota bacterium]